MHAYSRGRLARRMGRPIGGMPDLPSLHDLRQLLLGWDDEDDTIWTGVDDIQQAYNADRLTQRRAAEEQRFTEWVRSQRVAG